MSDMDFLFRPDLNHPKDFEQPGYDFQPTMSISPEMCNFILALAILIVRFPNSFWYSSRGFAFTFSFFLFCTALHLVINFCAFDVIFKVGMNTELIFNKSDLQTIFPSPLNSWVLLGMEGCAFLLLLISHIILYEYGHSQFIYSLRKYRQYISGGGGSTITTSPSDLGSDTGSGCHGVVIRSCGEKTMVDGCCYRFWPNIASFCLLIIILALKAPITYIYIQVYWQIKDPLLLTATIVNVFFLAVWLLVWFCFSVKTSWRFQVSLTSQTLSGAGSKLSMSHNPDPVYGFYPTGVPGSDILARFPGIVNASGGDCGSESSRTSSVSGLRGGSNYVYLQSNLPTIPTISENMDGTASDVSYDSSHNRNGNMFISPDSPGNIQLIPTGTGGFVAIRRDKMDNQPPIYATLASLATENGGQLIMSPNNHRIPTIDSDIDNESGSVTGSLNGGTLNRNSKTRRSGNRVTFKDHHDTIPGSPSQQSNLLLGSSSDSGMGGSFALQQQAIQQYINSQHQLYAKSPVTNLSTGYDDYAMFGNLFGQQQQPQMPVSTSMQNNFSPNSPATYSSSNGGNGAADSDFRKVPDILMTEQGMTTPSESEASMRSGLRQNHSGSNDQLEINGQPQQNDVDQSLCSQV